MSTKGSTATDFSGIIGFTGVLTTAGNNVATGLTAATRLEIQN